MATAASFSGWRVSGLAVAWDYRPKRHCIFFCVPRPLFKKKLRICELPHVEVATDMRALFAPTSTRRRGKQCQAQLGSMDHVCANHTDGNAAQDGRALTRHNDGERARPSRRIAS